MAEEQDKQQQNLLNDELVPINKQEKIVTRNFKIALEKTQPDVIYKVCLEILEQYSFYNAFIATADALKIYMQQFCYTISYDLTAKAFFFTMSDKVFEVNAKLLCNNVDFADLIWEEFKYQIESKRLDSTVGSLKFVNKGSKEPIFRMAIPVVMLNDDIKASAEYSKYLAKSKGVAPKLEAKDYSSSKGLKLLWKETRPSGIATGGEAHQESKEERVNHSEKLKGLETLCEGSNVTREVLNELVFKSSNKGVVVTQKVTDEPSNYSSSLSFDSEFRVEDISSDEAEVNEKVNNAKIIDAKKDTKDQVVEEQGAEKQPGNKELGANQRDNEPASDAQADVEMTDAQPKKHKATLISSHQTLSYLNLKFNQWWIFWLLKRNVQSMMDILVTQEKHVEPRPLLVDTTVTLIPDTTIISPTQPPQTQPKRRKTKVILKKSNKPDLQVDSELKCRVTKHEKKVHTISSYNLPVAIDKFVKAHLNNVLPKDVP
nr:hypothetical protein [Tanacetum cinerariifolium]